MEEKYEKGEQKKWEKIMAKGREGRKKEKNWR
jgi:hypothetical protein